MTAAVIGRRRLVLLVAGVLAMHLLLLRGWPETVRAAEPAAVPSVSAHVSLVVNSLPPPVHEPAPDRKPPATNPSPVKTAPLSRDPAASALAKPADPPLPVPTSAATATAPAQPAPSRSAPDQNTIAANVPAPARLRYQVTAQSRGQTWHAGSQLVFRHDGRNYEATLALSAALLRTRTQHSTGLITAEGLAPLRFSDKGRQEEATHFLREQGKLSFSSNRPDAPLHPGAQDRLSVLLQLGAMIAAAPARFAVGTTITIQTAGTREAEPWLFTVQGPQLLDLPGGSLQTLRLSRQPRKEFDQQIELWLAPSMHYLPVRLRVTQANGDWVDQQWAATDKD